MFDEEMHLYALFAKKLAASLPPEDDGLVNLEGQIDLTSYKLAKTGEQDIPLIGTPTGFPGIKGDSGAPARKEFAALSDIVEKINQRFGTTFRPEDQLRHFAELQQRVLEKDPRIIALADRENRATWDMLYGNAFKEGAGEAIRHSASFIDLLRTPGALEFVSTLMKENIWELAAARRKAVQQPPAC